MEYVMAVYHDRETAESALSDLERGAVKLDYSIIDRGQGMAGWWQRLFGARDGGGSLESAGLGLPDVDWYDAQLSQGRALAVVRADGFADRVASLLRVRGATDVRRYEKQDGEWRRMADGDRERWGLRDDAPESAGADGGRMAAHETPPADTGPRPGPRLQPARREPGDMTPERQPASARGAVAAALGPDVAPSRTAPREEPPAPLRTPPPAASTASRTEDRLPREVEAAPDAGGVDAAGRSRQRELEAENSKLRRLVVEQALDIAELRAALKTQKP